ncbi:MAG: hypothetical protein U0V70_14465 [Terriglobia bacterium]
MKKPLSLGLAVWVLVLGGLSGKAVFAEWVQKGPFGGHALKIVLDPENPDKMWVTTKNGKIYTTSNGAQEWTRLPLTLGENVSLNAIALTPKNSMVLYIGVAEDSIIPNSATSAGGVYKSFDGGTTWALLESTKKWPVLSVAVHPKNTEMVVAGTLDGVYRSQNGGTSWQRISPLNHPDLKGVVSLALDPENPNIIYAGTPHLPWRTMDGGATWKSIHQGMIDDSDMFSIAVDRTNPERVYASACSGIYRTSSRGEQWVKMQGIPGTNRRTHLILQDPVDEKILYAGTTQGLWKSQDGGLTWGKINAYPYVINYLTIDPRNHNVIFLTTDRSGILKSTDGGLKFQAMNAGFINRNISRFIAGDVLYASSLYDGDFGGVFSSRDLGQNWNLLASQAALQGRNVISIAISPTNPNLIFAGTYEGLLQSQDGGRSWRSTTGDITPVATRPPTKQELMSKRYVKPAPVRYVKLPAAKIFEVAFLKSSSSTLYAASSEGLFVSTDEGKRWQQVNVAGTRKAVYKVVIHPSDPDMIGLISADGIFISQDKAKTWEKANLQIGDYQIHDLALIAGAPTQIMAATSRGLFTSVDGGKSWNLVDGDLQNIPINQIVVSQADPSELYLLSRHYSQIFRSTDYGKTWTRLDSRGLENIRPLAIATTGRESARIFALSENQGIFEYIP